MKRLAMLLVLLAFATTGCGASSVTDAESPKEIKQDHIRTVTVELNDGNTVECVIFQAVQEGGLWCIDSLE